MICDIHGCEMEWIEVTSHPEGGYWYCEACQEEEEAYFTTPETAGTIADWGPWKDVEE